MELSLVYPDSLMAKKFQSISPEKLKSLSREELKSLCQNLREELIDSVSSSGGHFASSLGATEITVALHTVFNTPRDKLIWDVGHQGYIHKMITGRREKLGTIRKKGGISGFLKRDESQYDAFGAGHAGTSISAAVGMKVAIDNKKDPIEREAFSVAVIGDGSLTSGMAFEALNHAGALGLKKFVVVINDNEMSISENVGALSWLFSKAATSKFSTEARKKFKSLKEKGYVPEIIYKALDRAEEATQGFLATPAMLFEALGFRYIGPVDGHDLDDLIPALENAKNQDCPVVVHAVTVKGKGYNAAEEDPIKWHGVNPFDKELGKIKTDSSTTPSYTSVFADALVDACSKNPNVVGITAAMPGGTGLDKLSAALPQQFFDVGISEQHAVTFAAGLACEGIKPVVAIYSTFLQRGFDQVLHDVCIQNLPVFFAMDRSGVVGNDGETHQGVYDISYLRCIPNMVLMSPKDEAELRNMVYTGISYDGPIALRYPRGNGVGVTLSKDFSLIPIGKSEILKHGKDLLFIAYGPSVQTALTVSEKLSFHGISSTVINARFAKPLDTEVLEEEIAKHQMVITIEDHALMGGFSSCLLEWMNDSGISSTVIRFGVHDEFIPHASQAEQHKTQGYDSESIYEALKEALVKDKTTFFI